jgi:hypothetical protein
MAWLAVLAASAGAAAAKDTWIRARTENFEMFSSASERRSKDLLAELEQFRASVLDYFGLRQGREPRTTVVVFKSDAAFTPYKPLYQGRPKEVLGIFVPAEDEVVIALTLESGGDEEADPAETIFHEYVHQLFHSRGLWLPTWLNEGLAELFSTFRVEGDQAVYGRPKDLYVDLLAQASLLPLPRLLAVHPGSRDYNEEHRAGMFYAQSWALAHYLVCGTDRRNADKLQRLVDLVARGTADGTTAYAQTFGTDYRAMEQALRAYLGGGQYYQRRVPLPLGDLRGRLVFRAATDTERDLALLNLRWRVHRSGDAMLAALQLADRDPEAARPHELLAAIAAQDGDRERAAERWAMAAQRKSDNDFVHLQAVKLALRDAGLTAGVEVRLEPETAAAVRTQLDALATKDPRAEELLELLALAELRAPELRPAVINHLQQATARIQRPHRVLLALAMIRVRAGDIPTALHIVDAIRDSARATPDVKANAELLVLSVPELRRARAAAEAAAGAGSGTRR